METLAPDDWRAREDEHHARVDALLAGHLARRQRGEKHPVEDFLWVYYAHRPGQLRRWHPGPGVVLDGDVDPRGRGTWRFYATSGDPAGTRLDVAAFLQVRGEFVAWVRDLLAATATRPPTYSCFGLHEWAMVYGLPDGARRHEQLPLRLGREATDEVVRASSIRCSHFDAYRFFTPGAEPLNELRPTREGQPDQEQPGCLHATMDLYKWAFKLSPGVPSELVLDCLDLAWEARRLDMAASPYDVTAFGIESVAVETAQGRADYVARQRLLVERGQALRARVVNACNTLLTSA